ncbi:MAG: BamA/TamA family outer membrane protein, partial [Deltaproteobacteria bacterium]|nr:BamA/TamA family outer membrane protein [Deltaproteobacteria bacterium]
MFSDEKEIIQSISIENQLAEKRPDILSIIRMKVGDEFSRDKLENSINDLRKWGVFKNVEVIVMRTGPKIDLTYQLEDAYIIKDIEIHGNYPLLEKRIKRAIFFSLGDVYVKEKIPEQVDRIIVFYEKEGRKDTSVFIEEKKDEQNRMVTLIIKIEKGKTYRVGEVDVEGNTVFQDSRIKNKVSRIFGYKPNRVKKDLERITRLYRGHDYPRIKVKVEKTEYDEDKRTADLFLKIREGKKVLVRFSGNDSQFDSNLKKIVSVAQTGDTDEFELDYSTSQLIQHYQQLGFEDVKVSASKKEIDAHTMEVTFTIEEGPRRFVKLIDFQGNDHFSDKILRQQMLTKEQGIGAKGVFVKNVFDQDLENISRFYEKNGFLNAKVTDWKRSLNETQDKYLVDIQLFEGPHVVVDSVDFTGLHHVSIKELEDFILLKPKKSYAPALLEEDAKAIFAYLSYKGYPYAQVKTEVEEVSPQKMKIQYKIEEGPLVKIGKILFVGNIKTQESTIREALRFKEGKIFNPQEILESQTTLRKLGIFDSLSIETLGLKGKEEIIHIVVRVEEKKNKILDLGLTYDTDTSFKAKLLYSQLNLFGWGKRLDLKLTGGIQLNRAEIAYIDPRFFGSDWQFLHNIYAQYEKRPFFEDFQTGGSVAVLRDLTKRLSLLVKYDLSRTDFNEKNTDFALLRPGSGDNTTGKFQVSATYDKRDNFGDPHKGYYILGKTDFGTRFAGTGGKANFLKLGLRLGHWYSPFSRVTLANSLRVDSIIQLTGVNIPTQELIFLGGDDSVRGFNQDALNPLGSEFGIVHNFELQFRLFKGIELVGFLDSG